MEVLLKNNIDVVNRVAFDEDDYSLVLSQQGCTGEDPIFVEDYTRNELSFTWTTQPLYEYVILINADKPLIYDAIAKIAVTDDESTYYTVNQDIADIFPNNDGESPIQSCYLGFPYFSNETYLLPIQYTNIDSIDVDSTFQGVMGETSDYYLNFRQCAVSDFTMITCYGQELSLFLAQFDEVPANYNLKIWRKSMGV
jgi:hypothetical protein